MPGGKKSLKTGAILNVKIKRFLQDNSRNPSTDVKTLTIVTEALSGQYPHSQGSLYNQVEAEMKKICATSDPNPAFDVVDDDDDFDDLPVEPTVKLVEYKNHNMLNNTLYPAKPAPVQTSPKPALTKRANPSDNKIPAKRRSNIRSKLVDGSDYNSGGNNNFNANSDNSNAGILHTYSYTLPKERYTDMGGVEELLADIRELIEWPLMHPEIYQHLGVSPPVGVLLHGPPGCGKTLLAHAIGGELGLPFYKISAPEIVSGVSGESEAKLRSLFNSAKATAPSVIFIDELDAIAPKRETAQREMEKRIVSQLISCLDEICNNPGGNNGEMKGSVMVIGATIRPQTIDDALRRAGRFDRELPLGVPDTLARESILRVLASKLKLAGEFDYGNIARLTPGFVGADIAALTKESAILAIHRIFSSQSTLDAPLTTPTTPTSISTGGGGDDQQMVTEENEVDGNQNLSPTPTISAPVSVGGHKQGSLASRADVSNRLRSAVRMTPAQLATLSITQEDFLNAIKRVQPSAKREGFATVPNVSWEQVGALKSIRSELDLTMVQPLKRTDKIFSHLGLTNPCGILLYGPPGCGKTLLAKAIANEANANFISVKGPELLNKFVGESERAVRNVFQRARSSTPCIVFFDELDALCPKRSNDSSNHSSERVVNMLLTELDGLEERKDVFVIAATNRPDIIDPAMLRPGRFDKLLYVPLPVAWERKDILMTITKKLPVADDVDFSVVAEKSERFSGADLFSLVREAGFERLRDYLASHGSQELTDESMKAVFLEMRHFERALLKIQPSVSPENEKGYNRLQKKFSTHFKVDTAENEDSKRGVNENNDNMSLEPSLGLPAIPLK